MRSCPSSNGKGSRASLQGFRGEEAAEKGIQIIVYMQGGERGPKSDLMLWVQTD